MRRNILRRVTLVLLPYLSEDAKLDYYPEEMINAGAVMDVLGPELRDRKISILLANTSAMSADLLRHALQREEDFEVRSIVRSLSDLSTALDGPAHTISLIGASGAARNSKAPEYLEQIAAASPSTKQIVMASEMNSEDVVSYFGSGARGLLCVSETDVSTLVRCIRHVSMGQIWASAGQMDDLLRSLSHPRSLKVTDVLGTSLLTQREEQVLHLLADGVSNRELAAALKLSEHTVKNHLFRIFDKLGVSNRLEAVLYAITHREQQTPPSAMRSRPDSGVLRRKQVQLRETRDLQNADLSDVAHVAARDQKDSTRP